MRWGANTGAAASVVGWSMLVEMVTVRVMTVALFIGALFEGLCVNADNGSHSSVQITGIKGLVVPFFTYSRGAATTVAVLRIERFATDFQRRGFFRIGLLPILVADGVTLEFLEPGSVGAALERSRSQIQRVCGSGVIELRRVRCKFPVESDRQLEVQRVRFGQNGEWEMRDGVSWRVGTNCWQFSRALMQISGKKAGEISFPEAPQLRPLKLFPSHSATNSLVKQPEDP